MGAPITPAQLLRRRLAAQRLCAETAASSAPEAAAAVCGIQAQDVRASRLALRSRVPGIERADIEADEALVRTWTVRGTVHLIPAADHGWLHALTGERNRSYYERLIEQRGAIEAARRALPAMVAMLEERGPLSRAELLTGLEERGSPSLGPRAVNVLMPWACVSGPIVGLPDGRFRAADPPPLVDREQALATMGRRYLAGYGPATERDLAKWSGLPLGTCRRAFEAHGETECAGELHALPGTLDAELPSPPSVSLLAPFDTALLGWASREPIVRAADEAGVLPGGGILRAVALARGRAVATWRIEGSGHKRRLTLDAFGRAPAKRGLAEEVADVGRFLGLDLRPPA
ncbi:MAG: AlkZ family DNA glycosylase [Solirubrobacterales bacterium]|nr:AlkZ family DNA glycosylase [Solirubrobacterales bacterium]MCB8969754.1 AlkZ family DNA glycosylase [Thermoleophilales bacterium]